MVYRKEGDFEELSSIRNHIMKRLRKNQETRKLAYKGILLSISCMYIYIYISTLISILLRKTIYNKVHEKIL